MGNINLEVLLKHVCVGAIKPYAQLLCAILVAKLLFSN